MSLENIDILGSFNILSKSDDRFIIAGYASFDVVDLQGDRIAPSVIGKAFTNMMGVIERRNLNLNHSNIQLGRILPEYIDKIGRMWKSGADDRGLFVVAEIFKDLSVSQKIMSLMRKGLFLSYSIGGKALDRSEHCNMTGNKTQCYSDITDMELYEITLCERGANQYAKGFIIEKDIEKYLLELDKVTEQEQNNDMLKYNMINSNAEDKLMTEPIKTDLQIVMDELVAIKKNMTPVTIEQIKALVDERLKPVEVVKEVPKEIIKEVPKEVIKEIVKNVYLFEKPTEDKFPVKEDFTKALADYENFKKSVLEEAKKELGLVIAKKAPAKEQGPLDVEGIFNKALKAETYEDLLSEVN